MITREKGHRVIAAGEAKAKEIGQPMNIAIVDAGTNLKTFIRVDGARLGSIDIAARSKPPCKSRPIWSQTPNRVHRMAYR